MKRSKEELLGLANAIIGESTEDTVLQFLEDLSDSIDIEEVEEETENWEEKYHELDNTWREKYKARFFGGGEEKEEEKEEVFEEEDEEEKTIDDLFDLD